MAVDLRRQYGTAPMLPDLDHFKALVHSNHRTRGQKSPGAFIPIAESSDQIIRIDRWVMRNAVAEQACWLSHRSPTSCRRTW